MKRGRGRRRDGSVLYAHVLVRKKFALLQLWFSLSPLASLSFCPSNLFSFFHSFPPKQVRSFSSSHAPPGGGVSQSSDNVLVNPRVINTIGAPPPQPASSSSSSSSPVQPSGSETGTSGAAVEVGSSNSSSSGGSGSSSIRNKAAMFERRPENNNNHPGGSEGDKAPIRTPANPYKRWMADKVNLSLSVAAEDEDGSVLHLDTSNVQGGENNQQSSRSSPGAGNSPLSGGASSPHSPHSGGQLAGLRARRSVANNYAATPLGKRDRGSKAPNKQAVLPPPLSQEPAQEPLQEAAPASPPRNSINNNDAAAAAAQPSDNGSSGNVGSSGLMSPTVSSLLTSGALKRQRASAQAQAAASAAAAGVGAESPEKESQPASSSSATATTATPMKGPSMAEKMGGEKYQVTVAEAIG